MIRRGTRADRNTVTETLAAAMAQDPFTLWLTDGGGEGRLRAYTRLMFDLTIGHGGVHVIGPGSIDSAVLVASSTHWHLDLAAQLTVIPRMMRVVGMTRFFQVTETLDRVAAARPRGPWRLLALIGTVAESRGQGHGSALIQHALAQADSEGIPFVLETSVEANVRWYEQYGFSVFRSIPVGPKTILHMMERPASAAP